MKNTPALLLLATLGVLSLATPPAFAGDPSQWTCESCPFETGTSGSVEGGIGNVSGRSAKFGEYNGLERQGAFAIGGGEARIRRADGFYGNVAASDLGLDTRAVSADGGREGQFGLRLRYAELPHRLSDTASTPFLGVGSTVLTLPPGFPAATTADMPLSSTLQPVDIGFKRTRLDLGGSWLAPERWRFDVSARHDTRDGTQRSAGSFYSTTSQLVAPVDQSTDQIEATASYAEKRFQATLAYRASIFRNNADALTWSNPFLAPIAGATSGQLALAPDNEFHQVAVSAGYALTPTLRASVELAVGRMTQNAPYLAATLNPNLVVPPLPASSLDGRVATLDASVRLSAAPTQRLHLTASLTRNQHDNDTPQAAYPAVSTDLFLGAQPRINQPYSFTRDRLKLAADYRAPHTLKLAAGVDDDTLHRTLQESSHTHETTVWTRLGAQPMKPLALSLKLAHAERRNDHYDVVAAIQPPENPLLRKYNQADRVRDSGGLRADLAIGETVSVGLNADISNDNYKHSTLGLTHGHSADLGADVSIAISDETQLHAFAQGERIRSQQAGSQTFGAPDWTGGTQDAIDVVGVGVTHSALKGKLELGADLSFSRVRSDMSVDTGAAGPKYPTASASLDSLKLRATWRLSDKLSLIGAWWYESYRSSDWRLDGVAPATVPNLLAFGELAPRYHANVVRIVARYRF